MKKQLVTDIILSILENSPMSKVETLALLGEYYENPKEFSHSVLSPIIKKHGLVIPDWAVDWIESKPRGFALVFEHVASKVYDQEGNYIDSMIEAICLYIEYNYVKIPDRSMSPEAAAAVGQKFFHYKMEDLTDLELEALEWASSLSAMERRTYNYSSMEELVSYFRGYQYGM